MRRPRRAPAVESAKVVRVDLEEGLRPLAVEPRYERVLLVVTSGGSVVGQVMAAVDWTGTVTVERQFSAIAAQLEEVLRRQWLRDAFARATRAATSERRAASGPSVSVIVCTRDRPGELRACLDGLLALETAPQEMIVVDNAPSDKATEELCREYPVRYLLERDPGTSRAKNRGILEACGEVVAFVDDDCVVDQHWLDGLGDPFDDPLVMALVGYAGPLELETRPQYLFEAHGGFEHYPERRVFDGALTSPMAIAGSVGAGANSFFRRRVFGEVGMFAEDLGPGTPARGAEDKYAFYRIAEAGYRIVFDPARVVWHRHRRDYASLRRTLFGYTVGEFAYTTRCLVEHRQLGVLRNWRWWPWHLRSDLGRLWRGDERAVPLELVLAEAAGIAAGPWNLRRSRRSRRGIPALQAPPSRADGDERSPDGPPKVAVVGSEAPELSVVIASRNRRERLRHVLGALADQSYPPGRFETVIVLDGSTDESAEMVRSLELPYGVTLLEQDNRGVAACRNRGAREASHPVVVFLDDDIVPVRDFVAEHAGAHQRREAHVALGYYPPVLEGRSLWGYAVRSWWEDHFRRKAEPDHQWTYLDFADGNSSLPRALLLSFGGYDEDFKGRRQDWELAIRLLEGGVSFAYYPRAKGAHHLATSFSTALRHARQEGRDDVLLGLKHPRVRGQLPVGGEAGSGPDSPRRLVSLAYGRRDVAERALRSGPIALDALERLNLRGRWHWYAHLLLRLSYVLGVADVLPTLERFEEFSAPVWDDESVERLPVWLDATDTLEVPPGAGAVELELGYAGVPIAEAKAMEVVGQWDWREVTERVVQAAAGPMRLAFLLRDSAQAPRENASSPPRSPAADVASPSPPR